MIKAIEVSVAPSEADARAELGDAGDTFEYRGTFRFRFMTEPLMHLFSDESAEAVVAQGWIKDNTPQNVPIPPPVHNDPEDE